MDKNIGLIECLEYAESWCHHFRWKRKHKLESTQLEFGLQTHPLVSDCPTRGSKEQEDGINDCGAAAGI